MNIYVACTLSQSLEIINILKQEIPLRGIIGLNQRKPTQQISGFVYLRDYCRKNNLDFIGVKSYSLTDTQDQEKLQKLDLDLLLVLGWQRLIPEWFLNQCKIGAIGVHGSSSGITKGRGRSPQNWALILGKKKFIISIFFLNQKIDAGKVIDSASFVLTPFDNIQTSYYKTNILTAEMIIKNIKNKNIIKGKGKSQTGRPTYLPQRLPEDGAIDWKRSATEILGFINALTHPYPGAFTEINKTKITIWQARPFEFLKPVTLKPGTIYKVFHDGNFLVQTGRGLLLIEDYDKEPACSDVLKEGKIFTSVDFTKQIRNIIKRHQAKYPSLKIAREVLALGRSVKNAS